MPMTRLRADFRVQAPRGRAALLAAGLLALAPLSGAWGADAPRPRATLTTGVVEGTYPEGAPGAAFKGIPFAQPPVGPLRWHEPVAVKPWKGVRDASSLAPACVQNGRNGVTGSEDCLYLNVWTPQKAAGGSHPVMLWFFGGGNVGGSASSPGFDGASLARRGVVVVTANARPGVMGFLAHPALTAESPHRSSGNYMLLDQIATLRWIRDNIARFGGDPRNVTVFGQSSGSYDIPLLMTSPLARGLFSKAIAESGQFLAYNGPMPMARAESLGVQVAADLKAPQGKGALAYLRSLPAEQVVASAVKTLHTEPGTDTGLLTTVDGWVLPERPDKQFARGRQMPIPLLIGNNAREISPDYSPDELRRQITAKYGDLAPRALAAYGLANGGSGSTDPMMGGAGAQWMTDVVQRCAANVETEWHAGAGFPTWRYQFERSVPGREAVGATHGAEVAYVFGRLDRTGPDSPAYTEGDRKASDQIQAYWTRFAATGNPNGAGLPAWPAAKGGRYLAFTADGPTPRENLQPGPCGVYRDWALRRLTR